MLPADARNTVPVYDAFVAFTGVGVPYLAGSREVRGMATQISGSDVRGSEALGTEALGGVACFAASALLLPILSEYTLTSDYISELAIGRFGFVQTLAFLALGIGSLALAVGLRRATRGSWGSLAGTALFGLFGVGVLADALFPIDRSGMQPQTLAGTVHIMAALAAFVCAVLGMFVLTRTFKRDARWGSYWRLSLVLALAALVTFFLPSEGALAGIYQRIFVGIILTWIVLAALRLRSEPADVPIAQPARVR